MIIDSKNAICEAIKAKRLERLIIKDTVDLDKILTVKCENNIDVEILDKAKFMQYSGNSKSNVLGVVNFSYANIENLVNSEERFIVLDHIQDPQNFGAIIRAAHLFGNKNIIIAKDEQVSVTPAVVNASVGAIFYVNICRVVNLARVINLLKLNSYFIYAADVNAEKELENITFSNKFAIILGSEGKGIRHLLLKKSDFIFKIKTYGNVDSLNVSQSSAIIFYEVNRKLIKS
jgi:23S rRNA (guanosine2251-2'-O)-methyltransferase